MRRREACVTRGRMTRGETDDDKTNLSRTLPLPADSSSRPSYHSLVLLLLPTLGYFRPLTLRPSWPSVGFVIPARPSSSRFTPYPARRAPASADERSETEDAGYRGSGALQDEPTLESCPSVLSPVPPHPAPAPALFSLAPRYGTERPTGRLTPFGFPPEMSEKDREARWPLSFSSGVYRVVHRQALHFPGTLLLAWRLSPKSRKERGMLDLP